jgi:hypothetical protein
VPLATTPFGVARDQFGNVWAGSNGTTVVKLDAVGNVLGTFTVGSFPQSVAVDGAETSCVKLEVIAGNLPPSRPLAGSTAMACPTSHPSGTVRCGGYMTVQRASLPRRGGPRKDRSLVAIRL